MSNSVLLQQISLKSVRNPEDLEFEFEFESGLYRIESEFDRFGLIEFIVYVQGIILTSESEKLHSMNLLLYMAPMAACILLPFTLYIEGNVLRILIEKARTDPLIIFLLAGNATVAYLVNLTNFLVTKHTSALTLQVLGNGKAAVAAGVSVLIFRNPVTVMGIAGFGVTIMGVVLYSEARKRSKLLNQK